MWLHLVLNFMVLFAPYKGAAEAVINSEVLPNKELSSSSYYNYLSKFEACKNRFKTSANHNPKHQQALNECLIAALITLHREQESYENSSEDGNSDQWADAKDETSYIDSTHILKQFRRSLYPKDISAESIPLELFEKFKQPTKAATLDVCTTTEELKNIKESTMTEESTTTEQFEYAEESTMPTECNSTFTTDKPIEQWSFCEICANLFGGIWNGIKNIFAWLCT